MDAYEVFQWLYDGRFNKKVQIHIATFNYI